MIEHQKKKSFTISSWGWKWQVLTLDLQEWQLCWVFIKWQLISSHLSTSKLHWLIIFFLKPNLITKAQTAWSHISTTEKKKDCVKLKKFSNILVWKGHWRGSVSKEKMYFFFHFSSKLSLCVRRGRTFSFALFFLVQKSRCNQYSTRLCYSSTVNIFKLYR